MKEAQSINKSLSTLGAVMKMFVQFRDFIWKWFFGIVVFNLKSA